MQKSGANVGSHTRPRRCPVPAAMSVEGHEDAFPAPGANGRCRLGKATLVVATRNAHDAPSADLRIGTKRQV